VGTHGIDKVQHSSRSAIDDAPNLFPNLVDSVPCRVHSPVKSILHGVNNLASTIGHRVDSTGNSIFDIIEEVARGEGRAFGG